MLLIPFMVLVPVSYIDFRECETYEIPLDKLQFLDWADFQRYILAVVDQSDHLVNNFNYLPAFHYQHLTKHKSDSKKDSGFVPSYNLS